MADAVEKEAESKMKQSLATLLKEFDGLRTGRANVTILDTIRVDMYGEKTPLGHVGTLATPDPQTITIQPWDKKMIVEIEKAIRNSSLGLSPSNDGNLVRIAIPALTEERRKELTKVAKKYSEETKVAIRNLRRDANESIKKLEKDGKLSSDDSKKRQDSIQKLTDRYVAEADKLLKRKEEEIMK